MGSPFTNTWIVGYFELKNPKFISYNPGAIVKIIDLSSSHKKFSGQVLIVCISQGIANPFYNSPDFQSQRAEQFSAHKASLIVVYSYKALFSSYFVTKTLSISLWISSRALFTSSVSILYYQSLKSFKLTWFHV